MVEKFEQWINTTRGWLALTVAVIVASVGFATTLVALGRYVGQLETRLSHVERQIESRG